MQGAEPAAVIWPPRLYDASMRRTRASRMRGYNYGLPPGWDRATLFGPPMLVAALLLAGVLTERALTAASTLDATGVAYRDDRRAFSGNTCSTSAARRTRAAAERTSATLAWSSGYSSRDPWCCRVAGHERRPSVAELMALVTMIALGVP